MPRPLPIAQGFRCGKCESVFNTSKSLQHHDWTNHPTWGCAYCDSRFETLQAQENHKRTRGHPWRCYECGSTFGADDHLRNHLQTRHNKFPCEVCTLIFSSKEARKSHRGEDHFYCELCKKLFASRNGLSQHLKSHANQDPTIPCPFCLLKFKFKTAPPSLAKHLDTAACPEAPLDRETMYHYIRTHNPHGLFSLYSKGYLVTPKTKSPPPPVSFVITQSRTWNGKQYECFVCHYKSDTIRELSDHLLSSLHQRKQYQCPQPRCWKEFVTFGSLLNHLESEACGYMKFGQAQETFGTIS